MTSQGNAYEVALFGEFFARDLKAILNRITLHSEYSELMHTCEVTFEPIDAQHQRDTGNEPVVLRAKKELTRKDEGWILYSYLKPESVRAHPEATVRPWATCHVVGDALSFAQALGHTRRSQIYKRGYLFRRGTLVIQMFQQEQVDPSTQEHIPAHPDTLWEVEVKTATPIRNTQETPLSQSIDAVLEVQLLMKGLLDLRRQDV
ncbi:hypothetical protein DFJ43DRAFT_1130638 [Lentinula guzmanii]|uniref:Mediator of RNA polymerase II transcription subunit 18 n=4 Tax=Lentinula TaxID=5352 RepID=A0AA38JQT7_9AGAR|nr:hypothetical protein DFJ43DRAFT_1130638 [Lentinula guzmanii]KAJ3743340.1 hypothetical protein DFH05DRAFT_1198246 [Lentinula detonsa]KAJ3788827.1 hypothetical protein GGU10DRAFT_89016 [Lentinula aff. detonsa]KAJ3996023.1 hypothetical protein F5050DRAFT_1799840 [Lentinula boryana]KAJ3803175.1 hypothetical protein GGU11DRAFT_306999 [Lentinula aff. detonsa]